MSGKKARMSAPDTLNPILIVEDDRNIASLVATYLEREGFSTLTAHDGERALLLARRHQPMFVILDLMLPKMDDWAVCQELRRYSDVPVLMLTARGEEVDRLLGFALAADDYVVKPFSPRELVGRVKAILRRTQARQSPNRLPLAHRTLTLEPDKQKVTLDGRPVTLTPSEYRLLHTLMQAPGRIFSRRQLLEQLKVLRPLSQMMEVTGRLAAGDYSERVQVASNDEIGQLGVRRSYCFRDKTTATGLPCSVIS